MMKRALPIAALLVACASRDAAPSHAGHGDHVGVHNMTLFGSGASHLYLSHIPLYEPPHDLQLVFEVSIVRGVPAAEQRFGTTGFTISPERLSLTELASGTRKQLTATVYAGNVESGGRAVYRDVVFEVKQVIHRNPLVRSMPQSPVLAYLAVGSPSEAYLVHVIDRAPSFEQVLAVTLAPDSFLGADDLARGKAITIARSTGDVTARLAKGDVVDAVAPAGSKITVTAELTCLPGEEFQGACPPRSHPGQAKAEAGR